MDTNGIPISYRTFPGNTNDCETMYPYLKEIKRDFDDIGRVIVVADKGLNTSPNIVRNTLCHDGYVFSQKVRGANAELREYVLDESGYVWISDDYKIKSRIYPRVVHVKDIQGKQKQIRLDEKQRLTGKPPLLKREI
jgi:transposase